MDEVRSRQSWGEATIKTLLGRLMRKGAIRSARDEGRLLYHPVIDRRTYVEGEVQGLADRLFEGDRDALAAFLAQPGQSRASRP